jgi:hypothetical protein
MSSMQTRFPTGILLVCQILGGSISCVASLAGSVIWMYGNGSLPSPFGNSLDVMNLYRKQSSQCCRPLESLTPRPQTEHNRPLHTLDPTMPKGTLDATRAQGTQGPVAPVSFTISPRGIHERAAPPLPGQFSWTKCPPGRGGSSTRGNHDNHERAAPPPPP